MTEPFQDVLTKLQSRPLRPKSMTAFDAMLTPGNVRIEPGRRIVGQMCSFVAGELILAAGLVPIRLDFALQSTQTSSAKLPMDVCNVVHAMVQLEKNPLLPKVDLTIVPTACDGKKKLVNLLGKQGEVVALELPFQKRKVGIVQRWKKQIEEIVARLERLSGQKVTRKSLKQAIAQTNTQREIFREIVAYRRLERPRISAVDVFALVYASFVTPIEIWIEKAQILRLELERMTDTECPPAPKARLLVTGAPILWPDLSLLFTIQKAGAEVVADEMCSGTQHLYHPTIVDEYTKSGLILAASEKSLLPCTCPCFQETSDRLDRLAELIEQYKVNGVIHHSLRMCQNYDIDSAAVSDWLVKRHIPMLNLQTETGRVQSAAMQNRIEAFVEMLHDSAPAL